MRWWEWMLPWRWPIFQARKADQQMTQSRFDAAVAEAHTRVGGLEDAATRIKEIRIAKSIRVPPHRTTAESSPQ